MIDKVKNISEKVWLLIVSPSKTWEDINEDSSTKRDVQNEFALPAIGVCAFIVFVFNWIYKQAPATAFLEAVVDGFSLIGAYFIVRIATTVFINKHAPHSGTIDDMAKLVTYGFIAVFLVKIMTNIFPSMFFLKAFVFYTFFLVNEGCKALFDLPQSKHNNTVLLVSLMIILIPAILAAFMRFLLPNAQL